ncbi:putative bifunctional diguanylate cyclase/phosphodiesterase [Deinococcus petrolearius]|uniref:Bifunctional diguanylate cyclase/phosphodiesterase n=1 Tax=Deinococcus petrolearius TaxID=1751295 RepID=A0ABW1DG63_9DEIO
MPSPTPEQRPNPHLLSLQEIETLLRRCPVLLWDLGARSRIMNLHDGGDLGGVRTADLLGCLPPGYRAPAVRAMLRLFLRGGFLDFEAPVTLPSGAVLWLQLTAYRTQSGGPPVRLTGLLRDVTQRHNERTQLLEQQGLLRALMEQTLIGISIKDREGQLILSNLAVFGPTWPPGATPVSITGQGLLRPDLMEFAAGLDREALTTGAAAVGEIDLEGDEASRSLLMSKLPYWRGEQLSGTVTFAVDITARRQLERQLTQHSADLEARVRERTAELQAINDRLHHAAMHDTLTGLPNRAQLAEWSLALLGRAPRADGQPLFALLLIDLDHFKRINDRFGHLGGDSLLHALAQRLCQNLPAGRICRLGGDEFVVLLDDPCGPEEAVRTAEHLMAELRRPFTLDGREVQVGLSIGVTFAWTRHAQLQDLLDEADMAMYTEKRSSRQVRVFEPWMRERHRLLQDIQDDLPGAAERGELSVVFQPVVDLRRQMVQGAEALVRWQHPQHGLIAPGEFIPVAEAQGYVTAIDLWVLREAARQLLPLIRAGRVHQLAVNFSAQHFSTPDFAGRLQATLEETGLPLSALVVEITESLFMENHQTANHALREVIRLGASVAADDFGTGYSSLSYLQRLPLRTIKIDRSFVATSAQHPGIIRSIVDIAHTLGLRVVAEGIETEAQLGVLRELGCDYGQGYLLARPMGLGDLNSWLREWEAARSS